MASPTLIRSFTAGATVNPRRLVKFGSNDREVIQAAAATDLIVMAHAHAPRGATMEFELPAELTESEHG